MNHTALPAHRRAARPRRAAPLAAIATLAMLLSACASPTIQGRVVHGPVSHVSLVNQDDPRLDALGIDGATIDVILEPQSLGRERIASQRVNPDGSFAIPIDRFGAGLLEYEFGILVRREGHDSAQHFFRLPRRDQRLLVTLSQGPDRYVEPDDPVREAEQFLPRR